MAEPDVPGSNLSSQEFRALLDLYMVSDPWPLSGQQQRVVKSLLDSEARCRDFDGWVHAYHDFEAAEDSQDGPPAEVA